VTIPTPSAYAQPTTASYPFELALAPRLSPQAPGSLSGWLGIVAAGNDGAPHRAALGRHAITVAPQFHENNEVSGNQ
jgi:hypothetical protein